jgi:pilus assembly protein Flp/PilA
MIRPPDEKQSRHERGASAVEYGLMVAAIAAVIVAVVFAVGSATGSLFQRSCESIEDGSGLTASSSCPGEDEGEEPTE